MNSRLRLLFTSKATVLLGGLALFNIAIWALAIILFRQHTVLLGTALLAYGFGLRHAVDADHIAAIDNVSRKLMQEGKPALGVGLYFSLGHSTIVFALSAAVAGTALVVKNHFAALEAFGNAAGTMISALFLLTIALVNIVILAGVFRTFRNVAAGARYDDVEVTTILARRGLLSRLLGGLFKLVNSAWQMYPVGVLFGLGFDTATEIGLLGISAAAATKGLPIWSILMFPALFTAGMALIDTADSVLMAGMYGWAFTRPLRKLYYNITITAVSVLVALAVGGLETLGLLQSEFSLGGRFWNGVASLNNNFGLLGYGIIAIFMVSWLVSAAVYRWRRYDEREAGLGG
jgi:high-affinity nickel-transport protein